MLPELLAQTLDDGKSCIILILKSEWAAALSWHLRLTLKINSESVNLGVKLEILKISVQVVVEGELLTVVVVDAFCTISPAA